MLKLLVHDKRVQNEMDVFPCPCVLPDETEVNHGTVQILHIETVRDLYVSSNITAVIKVRIGEC